MNLTKEYLDKALKGLATKTDLAKHTELLMAHTSDQIEGLARMVQAGFEDVQARLDVSDRVKKLEQEMKEIREALQV